MTKIGIVEEDIINLIKWKKSDDEHRKKMVCNQLSMVEDFTFHDFWWKMNSINKELYWELQYVWLDNQYFHTGVHKERIRRAFKMWKFYKLTTYLPTISSMTYYYIQWATWETTVKANYLLYVQAPFIERNTTHGKNLSQEL